MTDQEIEGRIIRKTIRCLLKDPKITLSMGDDRGDPDFIPKTRDPAPILAMCEALADDVCVKVYRNGAYHGWVRFVFGNGPDVISDYTVNLESALEPAMILASNLDRR